MTPPKPPEGSHWSLDKRIPIALLVGLLGSTVTVGGTAIIAHHRLGNIEGDVRAIEARLETEARERRQYDRDAAMRERAVDIALTELRASAQALREAVGELRQTLQRLPQRSGMLIED